MLPFFKDNALIEVGIKSRTHYVTILRRFIEFNKKCDISFRITKLAFIPVAEN